MSHKNLINPVTVTALATLAVAIFLAQFWEIQFKDVMVGIFVLTLYGLLIGSYILRIALVFLGVFAIYRMLWKRANGHQEPTER